MKIENTFYEVIKNKELLWFSTLNSLKQKYAGHVFGILWLILNPIILLTIYTVIYLYVFKLKPVELNAQQYVLYIFSGLVPFLAISESLSLGTNSITQNESILKNITFPISILPVQSSLIPHLTLIISMALVGILDIYYQGFSIHWVWVPLVMLLQFVFLTGINFLTSLLSVLLKDVQNVISFVSMVIMLASPIAYFESIVPEKFQIIIKLNPFAYFFKCYQHLIALNELPPMSVYLPVIVLSFSSVLIGALIFARAKKVIAMYV